MRKCTAQHLNLCYANMLWDILHNQSELCYLHLMTSIYLLTQTSLPNSAALPKRSWYEAGWWGLGLSMLQPPSRWSSRQRSSIVRPNLRRKSHGSLQEEEKHKSHKRTRSNSPTCACVLQRDPCWSIDISWHFHSSSSKKSKTRNVICFTTWGLSQWKNKSGKRKTSGSTIAASAENCELSELSEKSENCYENCLVSHGCKV